MIVLALIMLVTLILAVYLLGFRLGGDEARSDLFHVRQEAIRAERHLHDLTRRAFTAMAEEMEKRKRL